MTDNDIIKALECCDKGTCFRCPYRMDNYCMFLDLINRQKEEIESLKSARRSALKVFQLSTEIRAEAIKEFADKLQKYLADHNAVSASYLSEFVKKLAKELTEGDSNAEITE